MGKQIENQYCSLISIITSLGKKLNAGFFFFLIQLFLLLPFYSCFSYFIVLKMKKKTQQLTMDNDYAYSEYKCILYILD